MSAVTNHLQTFYTWHSQYYNDLMMMGLRLGWEKEMLKDIINQVFLDLIEKNVDPSLINTPKAFLTTTFKRKLIDADRKNKRIINAHILLEKQETRESSTQEKWEETEDLLQLVNRLKALYENLPPRCKKVIYLKFYEALSTEQIIERTGLSARSVYNNLFEGIKLLRAEMAKSPMFADTPYLALLMIWLFS